MANASPHNDADFLRRIEVNYLRHELSSYDDELAAIYGRVGVREAYCVINAKVYSAIGEAYPHLEEECLRQMVAKSDVLEVSARIDFSGEP